MDDGTSAGTGRRRRRREQTRQALLTAARTLLAEVGFHRTSIAAIAERADVGFGTFYLHFPHKASIMRAVLLEGLGELRDRVRAARPRGEPGPAAALTGGRAMLDTILTFAYENRDLFRIVLLGQGAGETMVEAQRLLRADLEAALTAAAGAGLLGEHDPALITRFVVGAVSQAIVWWFDHDEPPPDRMAVELDAFLRHGLLGLAGATAGRPPAERIRIE